MKTNKTRKSSRNIFSEGSNKVYLTLSQFFKDYPLTMESINDKPYLKKMYYALYYRVNDANFLNEEDRKSRSKLLVLLGKHAGIIKDNFGRPYNESRR
jgi:hypothetical protein